MEIIISIIALLVMVTVTAVLLYQQAVLKDSVSSSLQSIVDQINDSTYYAYQFDKTQENNIKSLDKNVVTVSQDLTNTVSNLNNTIYTMNAIKEAVPTKGDLARQVNSQQVATGILTLGDKFSLSALGTRMAGEEGEWIRLLNKDGTNYYGGLALDKVIVKSDMKVDNRLCIGGYEPNNCLTATDIQQLKRGIVTNPNNTLIPRPTA